MMIRLLLKKQITEIFSSYVYDRKNNKARSTFSTVWMIFLFAALMIGLIGGLFGYLSSAVCEPFAAIGMDWFFFGLMGLLSILLGVFGSVFSTYSGLYLSKDNDLLLSMPVPPRAIIISRLLSVYVMGLMYSAVVLIPSVIVYFIKLGFSPRVLFGSVSLLFTVSLIDLILSCVLGWVVAKISVKLKNKSIVSVLISILFIALYYFVYFNAVDNLSALLENAAVIGENIIGKAYPVYLFGMMGIGDGRAVGIYVSVCILLTVAVYAVLSRTFIKIATASAATARVKGSGKIKSSSASAALYKKEIGVFTSSSVYMLNCGLGVLLLPALGIFLIVKSSVFSVLMTMFPDIGSGTVAVILCAVICTASMMNDTGAPSVSLEGKRIWIPQSLPVTPWQVIRAKLLLHLTVSLPPIAFCLVCAFIVISLTAAEYILVALTVLAFNVLTAFAAMFFGLKFPNLTWTRDIIPIKQSTAVIFTMLTGFVPPILFGAGYLLIGYKVGSLIYLSALLLLFSAVTFALYKWCRTRGGEIFANL